MIHYIDLTFRLPYPTINQFSGLFFEIQGWRFQVYTRAQRELCLENKGISTHGPVNHLLSTLLTIELKSLRYFPPILLLLRYKDLMLRYFLENNANIL